MPEMAPDVEPDFPSKLHRESGIKKYEQTDTKELEDDDTHCSNGPSSLKISAIDRIAKSQLSTQGRRTPCPNAGLEKTTLSAKISPERLSHVGHVGQNVKSLRKMFRIPVDSSFRALSSGDSATENVAPTLPMLPSSSPAYEAPTGYRDAHPIYQGAPVPRTASCKPTSSSNPRPKTKEEDELLGVFRALDKNHSKFSAKREAMKASFLKSNLLPLLRQNLTHPSNGGTFPERLVKRAIILNKWWKTLLEMMHGCNNQPIPETDMQDILEGISRIMERPEWLMLAPSSASSEKLEEAMRCPTARSTTLFLPNKLFSSPNPTPEDMRNVFVQNLRSQMAFVVDRMSTRNPSTGLVSFCGKTCAYAFMFIPGIADVLVRLWDVPVASLKRVLAEAGIGRSEDVSGVSENIIAAFPPELHSLGFSSLKKMLRKLQTPPPLPAVLLSTGMNHVDWRGYWLERWNGRESDLFYVFTKYYHILVSDFIRDGLTKKERMCIPGLLLIHGQILTNLDFIVRQDAGPNRTRTSSTTRAAAAPAYASTTLKNILRGGSNAIASNAFAPPTNATPTAVVTPKMIEGRLLKSARDLIDGCTKEHQSARQLFAESFNDLLQATTRGVSILERTACSTLLDFLKEALAMLARFEHLSGFCTVLNSRFWLEMCTRMIASENTTIEIGLYSFLFTTWDTVFSDTGRRFDLCTGFLLEPGVFETRFNHWCPIVRAYYMRLLCWRIGRHDGDSPPTNVTILKAMRDRLMLAWSHYLWLQDDALRRRALQPPTNPCNPAPSRSLFIVRADTLNDTGSSALSRAGGVPPDLELPIDNHPGPPPKNPHRPANYTPAQSQRH